jgi:CRP/FNR family transcriptional regulator, transcriptional activator FtrB
MALHKSEVHQVRSIPLFRKLSETSLPVLLGSASIQHFPRRKVLFREGDRAHSLFILIHGSVELFSEHDHRRSTITVVLSGRPFVLACIEDNINPVSAGTLERTQLMSVPLETIHRLLDRNPIFARAVTCEVVRDLRETIETCKNQRLRTTLERLAEWILRADQHAGSTGQFTIPHDKRILASYLGMEAESLSRNLASLAALGVIVRGREISLTDRAALARVAGIEVPSPALSIVDPARQDELV